MTEEILKAPGAARVPTDQLFESSMGRAISLPRLLVTGDDSVEQLGDSLKQVGVAPGPVLLVADSALIELGVVIRLERLLSDAGFEPTVHGQIAGEPDLAAAEAIVDAVRAGDYAAVVGLGGGSALDPAKLAAGRPRKDSNLRHAV